MSAKKQKNFRLSDDAAALLARISDEIGVTDTRVVELCLGCYAVGLGVEVKRAHEFLYQNLTQMIATHIIHRPANRRGFHPKLKLLK